MEFEFLQLGAYVPAFELQGVMAIGVVMAALAGVALAVARSSQSSMMPCLFHALIGAMAYMGFLNEFALQLGF